MDTPTRVFDLFEYQLEHFPRPDAFAHKIAGQWKRYPTEEVVRTIDALAWGLHQLGIQDGDRVANIIETNRPEWNFIDGAVMSLGGVHLPIYPNISSDDFEFILKDSEAKLLFVSSARLYSTISKIRTRLPNLQEIYTYDPVEGARQWTEIRDRGRADLDQGNNRAELTKIKENVSPEALAMLLYTSGTTGTPKGVMLSHRNLISNCQACGFLIQNLGRATALSFLPLCHIFERTATNIWIKKGLSVYYAESLEMIGENMREVRPDIFTTVPRLLEKIYERILARGNALSGFRRQIFFWALALAKEYDPNIRPSLFTLIQLRLADRLVFSKWREALGGRVKVIVSGSAALQPRLARIFWAAKLPVYEGYGPTEASPGIAISRPEQGGYKIGTVGPVIAGGQVKIADDGEILYRGPNVMMGYYRQPELTAETIDSEGWLHTGDIGEFDGPFLKITDRKKEMFKTSGGKYVPPQQIENKMKESPFISQIIVVGEYHKFPAALIVPAFDTVSKALEAKGVNVQTKEELVAHPETRALIQRDVDRLNQQLGRYLQVKKFALLKNEWTPSAGELTPTMKLKRKQIHATYAKEIDALYADEEMARELV
jgi:long-chain acyl-CoA synthetase